MRSYIGIVGFGFLLSACTSPIDNTRYRETWSGNRKFRKPIIKKNVLTPKQKRAREKAKRAKQARKKQRNVLQQVVVNHYKHIYK